MLVGLLRLPDTGRRLLASGVVACLLLAGAVPTATAAEHDSASARRRAAALAREVAALQRQTAEAVADYDRTSDEMADVVSSSLSAEQGLQAAVSTGEEARRAMSRRVRALYMGGGGLGLYGAMLDSRDLHDALARYRNIESVIDRDRRSAVDGADGVRRAQQRQIALRADALRSIKLTRETEQHAARIRHLLDRQQELLARADATVRRLMEEERRAAEAARARAYAAELAARAAAAATAAAAASAPDAGPGPAPSTTGRYACPLGPLRSFIDTWGAVRSGGRSHEGTDLFSPRGSPANAVTDGVVTKAGDDGGLGGIRLWLRGDNGDTYYYAHNEANLVKEGQRVRAGQQIALVGTSGNAEGTPPHVHFEVHPRGGSATNPYPMLKAICG